jgi:hypothetical protein
MERGTVYLGNWVIIHRYKCKYWMCSIHGKLEKQVEVVRVVSRVYFVNWPREGLVRIYNRKRRWANRPRHAPRDSPSPKCKHCLKDNVSQ